MARDYNLSTTVPTPGIPIGYVTFNNTRYEVQVSEEWRRGWFENVGTALFGPDGSEDITADIPVGSFVVNITGDTTNGLTVSGTPASGWTPVLTLAQSIKTTASPQFAGLNIAGNIVCSGTVDTRDLSVDGAKLDGIESGATADQTAGEILTALLTVDGAASGLDADLLDGQHGTFYLSRANHTGTQTSSTISDFNTAADARVSAGIATHEAASDPHTGYQKESEKNAVSGYAGLNASSRITKGGDATDDFIFDDATKGVVLKDTQGTPHYWRVTIDNTGTLVTTDLGTTKP